MNSGLGRAPIVLASGSAARARMLKAAGVAFEVRPAQVDEEALIGSLTSEGAQPRDVADALAELKAARASARMPGRLVLGADQVLSCGGEMFQSPWTAPWRNGNSPALPAVTTICGAPPALRVTAHPSGALSAARDSGCAS